MKFIIEDTGQVIDVTGRKFYYPPKDKLIEDRYLTLWPPEKLNRYGICLFIEEPEYDKVWYKRGAYTDVKDGYTITRTYSIVPLYGTGILGVKNKLVKREGVQLYSQAIRIEPLTLFTGDTYDIASYKNALLAAYDQAKTDVLAIVNGSGTQLEKYNQIAYYEVAWPDMPFSEEDLTDYGL